MILFKFEIQVEAFKKSNYKINRKRQFEMILGVGWSQYREKVENIGIAVEAVL